MICGLASTLVHPSFSAETSPDHHSADDSKPPPATGPPANTLTDPTAAMATETQSPSSMLPQKVLLKDIALLWTGEDGSVQSGMSVFIDNGIIQWVGDHNNTPSSLLNTEHAVEDMSNRLVTPGLVNTHHHMYQSLTKCMARESQLFEWLQYLYPVWQHLTPDMVYKSAKFAMAELLLSGCTLSSDMLYLYPNGVTLDDTIRAAQELGMRFMPCRGAVSVGKSNGGLPPDTLIENEEAVLADMKRLIETYHDSHDGAMIRIALAPCSPFSVSEALMKKAAALARQYQNVMLHTHFAENSSDIEYMKTSLEKGLTQFLDECGWNKKDCWFAHCVKLGDDTSSDAIQYFADKGLGVAHCPVSNCRLASGIAPIREMLDKKVKVGMGVDGSASNDSGNLLSEARMALMLARVKAEKADALSAVEALKMATSGGAAVLGRTDVGTVRAGMCADMVAWRLDAPSFAGAFHSKSAVLSALVLGNGGDLRADYVMVNGKAVVRDGMLASNQKMTDITREHNQAALRLARAGEELQG